MHKRILLEITSFALLNLSENKCCNVFFKSFTPTLLHLDLHTQLHKTLLWRRVGNSVRGRGETLFENDTGVEKHS
jgi:hypothetical protein